MSSGLIVCWLPGDAALNCLILDDQYLFGNGNRSDLAEGRVVYLTGGFLPIATAIPWSVDRRSFCGQKES